jgi:class 3 adenylate cyclase
VGEPPNAHAAHSTISSMSTLPSGTVTFVFTDIEGSTELLKRLGDRYSEVLRGHRRIVRETFSASDGVEIDTQGDAFFYVFARARDAVAAAVAAQRLHATSAWPDDVDVRVRIGLHTGEPAVHEEGYLGLDVVRAARICTVGRGGHILLSETTKALVGSTLPDGVSVFPLGERHLRGIDEPERVYELEIAGLEAEAAEEPRERSLVSEPRSQPEPRPEESPKLGTQDLEKRFEDLGSRLAAGIEERVLGSLERTLGKAGTSEDDPGPGGSTVDDLASRAATLEERINARVEEALRRKGIPRKDPG